MSSKIKIIKPALILSFAISFMLFIYEPIVMYLNNTSDFWFDLNILVSYSFITFLILFLFITIVYIIIYLIDKRALKGRKKIYETFLIFGFCMFFVTYIQGNYLSGKLPPLDGKTINWNNYTFDSIISAVLLIIVFGITILLIKKYKFEKTIKWSKNITLAICAMLAVSLTTTFFTVKTESDSKKYTVTATTNYINNYSTDKNFIILLLDSIDSETMEKIVQKDNKYLDVFDDFTYFPDTVGGYPFTRDTVPLVLSGNWSENKTDFTSFYNEAMDNSKLLDYLRDYNYNINIYNDEISYNTEKAKDIKNFSFNNKVDLFSFIKQELKYDLFKYLPFYLKKYSKIETMNFIKTRKLVNDELFLWDDTIFLDNYLKRDVTLGDNKEFKYIHLEGAHYPFDCDKNFNKKENGTYEEKIEGSIILIDKYLKYLKENDIYDNSAIIILADHGFWWEIDDDSLLKRQNPILYIKGFDEHHKREVSDEKVSFDNLQDMYNNLLNGNKAEDVMEGIDTTKPRRFMLYRVFGYNHMEEFLQYGHSKDLNTLKKSGNVYDLD